MPKTDKRVDAYIAKSPAYAVPILSKIRAMVHEAAPSCEETIKWGHPTFTQQGILLGMAAFKSYCVINIWKGKLILGEDSPAYASLGKIETIKDLPSKKEFTAYVKRAVELNEAGVKPERASPKPKKPLAVPADFRQAIAKNAKAHDTFEAFSPSHKREYVEWIVEAKQDATRAKRIAQALEWLSEGKPRNWKYMKTK